MSLLEPDRNFLPLETVATPEALIEGLAQALDGLTFNAGVEVITRWVIATDDAYTLKMVRDAIRERLSQLPEEGAAIVV